MVEPWTFQNETIQSFGDLFERDSGGGTKAKLAMTRSSGDANYDRRIWKSNGTGRTRGAAPCGLAECADATRYGGRPRHAPCLLRCARLVLAVVLCRRLIQ